MELVQSKERVATLTARVAELEADLNTAHKDLLKSEEMSSKYQRDIREVRGPAVTCMSHSWTPLDRARTEASSDHCVPLLRHTDETLMMLHAGIKRTSATMLRLL